jgi:hypothetical protein
MRPCHGLRCVDFDALRWLGFTGHSERVTMQTSDDNPPQTKRRLMHRRSVECLGYLRDDGLWEVEARLVDTKPFDRRDRDQGIRPAGDPVHDIRLRLAVDDTMTVRETGTTMFATPYPSCVDVEGILQRLVGERIGQGWRQAVRRKIGRLETCTHLAELLGPAVTTLFQAMSNGKDPEGRDSVDNHAAAKEPPFFIDGCYSWRKDGPNVAEFFPQFATKAPATDA